MRNEQISLGEIIEKMKLCDQDAEVRFDFGSFVPDRLCSWRGSYDELSIVFADYREVKTRDFLSTLQSAVGQEFGGWKGGDYRMFEDTPVWVSSEPSDSGNTVVTDVIKGSCFTVILTSYGEY